MAKDLGSRPLSGTVHLTEGDHLTLIVGLRGNEPVPTPVSLWWPDGTVHEGIPDPSGTSVAIVVEPAEVDRLIGVLEGYNNPRAQLDAGTVTTAILSVSCHRTPRGGGPQ